MSEESSKAVKPLRVAVSGGSGRIGRAVVRELVGRGHNVINLDRRASPDVGADGKPIARFVLADLTRREQIQPVLEQCDAAIQLAEITHSNAPFPADEIFSHNTRVASAFMQSAADLKLQRIIYTSSCQAYGCWDDPNLPPLLIPFDETHPLRPQNVYALSKFANEHYAQFVARRYGLSVAIFRLPWVLTHDSADYLVDRRARDIGPLDGMGTYIHVDDAARAYALAIENPRPGCEAYHLTADDISSWWPLRDHLRFMPGYPPLPADWPDHKSPLITEKARQHFKWRPLWNLREQYRRKYNAEPPLPKGDKAP